MKLVQTHVKFAVATGLILIVLNLATYMAGLAFNPWVPWIGYIIFLVSLILNANAYSKANDANVTFGNVFGSCFKQSAIMAVMIMIWTAIFMMIFPEFKDKLMEMNAANFEKRGMSEEQIESANAMTDKFFFLFGVGGSLVMYLFWGTIFSLIAAAVAKKNPQQQQQMQ